MPDKLSPQARSANMSRVRSRNTRPEVLVRQQLHKAGFRFRLNRRDLPGAPDIVLPRFRTVVFVHGCFWHGHSCKRGTRPSSNTDFWNKKIDGNMDRDRRNVLALGKLGWRVETVWACSLVEDVERAIQNLRENQ